MKDEKKTWHNLLSAKGDLVEVYRRESAYFAPSTNNTILEAIGRVEQVIQLVNLLRSERAA